MLLFACFALALLCTPTSALLSIGQSYPSNGTVQDNADPIKLPIYPTSDRYASLVVLVWHSQCLALCLIPA